MKEGVADMKLHQLLEELPDGLMAGSAELPTAAKDLEIKGLCTNSHACQAGDLFMGMPGTRVDGGEFWPGALEAGAVAALVSEHALQQRPLAEWQRNARGAADGYGPGLCQQ